MGSTAQRLALFTEPSCGLNQLRRATSAAAGCPAPTPGSAAGGCSFDGAMITLVPIADVAHVVHGPIGCLGTSWEARGSMSSGPTLNRHGFTTDLTENDIVMGGEQKLFDTLLRVAERHRPAALFVYSTCVPAMTGDDMQAVAAAVRERTGLPVVVVQAPGFVGTKNFGNRLAGNALLDHVIGTQEPAVRTDHDVALIGEYNIAGELWNVLPTLERAGLRVLSSITGDGRYADVAAAHRARAAMVVCSRALLPLARGLHERHGVPFFEGSFYGLRAMGAALRGFAGLLDDPQLTARVEAVVADEQARCEAALAPWRERLAGVRAVLYTGGVKSWSMIAALQDLGVQVVASGATKSTEDDVERMRALMGDDGVVMRQGKPQDLIAMVERTGADVLIAGGRNQYTALKSRLPFVDVNQERHTAFAGYDGLVSLARTLHLTVSNPVFDQVRHVPAWERRAPEQVPVPVAVPTGTGTRTPIRTPTRPEEAR